MLEIFVSSADEPRWCRTFVTEQVAIGGASDNQLVLAAPSIAAHHALVMPAAEGKLVVAFGADDWKTPSKPMKRLVLAIGPYKIEATRRDAAPIDGAIVPIRAAIEQQLIDAIVAGDDASRVIYADWLEARGEHARAEWLRVEHALLAAPSDAPDHDRLTARLRALSESVDLAWRSRLARPAIEGCPQFEFACPKQWEALAPTAREGVRACGACHAEVFYCASIEEARDHAGRGECVALDVTSPRYEHDLAGPFGTWLCRVCSADLYATRDTCTRCGAQVQTMVRGRMRVR